LDCPTEASMRNLRQWVSWRSELYCLSEIDARSLMRRILESEEGLVQLILDRRDADPNAIRREGNCR
jgi:hypothetical protein